MICNTCHEPRPGASPADDIRHKMVEMFKGASGVLTAFYDYSRQAAALAEEYHAARFSEHCPTVVVEALTLAYTLDSRETPASLDKKLAALDGAIIKKIVFDQARATYYLFV
jgi:predicted anti-sigma-YlaC factor YlaD